MSSAIFFKGFAEFVHLATSMFNVTPKEIRSKNRKEKQLRVTLPLVTLLEFWHNLDVTRQKHLKKVEGKIRGTTHVI